MNNNYEGLYNRIYAIIEKISKISERAKPEELDEMFQDSLANLGLVAWKRTFVTGKSNVAPKGIHNEKLIILSGDEYNEADKISYHYDIEHFGYFECEFYPGKIFDDSEVMRKHMEMISRGIWFVYGRGFLANSFDFFMNHDPLTGSYNRGYLEALIGRLCAQGVIQNYVGAVINIKNFRSINERYGDQVGNMYLNAYCDAIMQVLNEDECFTRLGGDNFVLFVNKARIEFFNKLLLKIEFVLPTSEGDVTFHVRMRAGVYLMKENDSFGNMMAAGNEALHIAHLPEQRDFVWYEEVMRIKRTTGRLALDSFPDALKNHEFVPYYQPKVLLDSSSLYGAEALCRWLKDGKVVPPGDFIPALEDDGAITKLDFYMLDRVCADIAKWADEGLDPGRISVNFSKNHLHDENFGSKIVAIIDRHNVNHHNIEIELTETSGFDNNDAMRHFVSYMKSEDIHTSIDDFGTGSSSLNMLSGLGMDIVKLDKSFVDDLEYKSSIDRKFVKNIINMINELGIETVAEGVEGIGQASLLQDWNCRVVQGYLYDRPLPEEEFVTRISDIEYYLKKEAQERR